MLVYKEAHVKRKTQVFKIPFLLGCLFGWGYSCQAYPESTFVQYYQVSDEAPTLGEIGIHLYGTTQYAKKISEWNHLANPNYLRIGQKLLIKERPTQTAAEGKHAVLSMWRKQFGLDDVLSQKIRPNQNPIPKPQVTEPSADEFSEVPLEESTAQDSPQLQLQDETREEKTAQEFLKKGEADFVSHEYISALKAFHRGREVDVSSVGCWLGEIKTLRILKRTSEEKEVSHLFLEKYPTMRILPFFTHGEPAHEDQPLLSKDLLP